MTVKELIEELKTCDQETPVRVQLNYAEANGIDDEAGDDTGDLEVRVQLNYAEANGILRIDKLLGKTLIVVQQEIN